MPLGANKAAIMGVSGVSTGDVVLLATNNITSGVSASAFTSGITSTYGEYVFKFYGMHPATDDVTFQVNFSIDGGSNYNVTKTTTFYQGQNGESSGDGGSLSYKNGEDLAQATGYQSLGTNLGNDADQHAAGELRLFNPASTTYAKHFLSRCICMHSANYANDTFITGYINTTSAVNAISFQMSSGNIDVGKIKMWGVK